MRWSSRPVDGLRRTKTSRLNPAEGLQQSAPWGRLAPGRLAAFGHPVGRPGRSNSRDAPVTKGIFMAYPVSC